MTSMCRASLWVLLVLVFSPPAGFAQTEPVPQPDAPPAHLSIIEGTAFVERDGRSDAAVANLPLLDGDRLRTEDGRLEVILPDGSLLHLDRATTLDVMAADLFRLLQGRVYVIARGVRDPQRAVRYQIDAPVAAVQTGGPGEFRVWSAESSRGHEVELAVFRGQATIANTHGTEELRAGERSIARDGFAPSAPRYFNSARWDDFDRWSASRRDESIGTVSVQYLPSELAPYASTFDRYGTWRSDEVEGAVWYPSVPASWRPYSVGYWHSYPAWGSFWIGRDPWGWPTHHYGYWGFSIDSGWYWRPASIWGPAWVHWAYSPGYISWCPLGRHGYPVFGHFGVRGGYSGSHVDPWRGWTVVPRRHFGTPTPVHRVAVDGGRLDPAVRGTFAAERRGIAPERAAAGRPGGGGLAAPRSPAYGASALPARGSRPGPDEAARILAGSGNSGPGGPSRRPLPAAPAYGGLGQRTEAPLATPDVSAFGSRRNLASAYPRRNPGADPPAQFGNGTPAQFGNGSPAQFGNGLAPGFASGTRQRAYPRAAPSSEPAGTGMWSPPPSGRQNPYGRANGGSVGGVERRAYPRASEPAPPSAPPDRPYVYGGGGGAPSGPQARPRDGAGSVGGVPAGSFFRGGGSGGPSAPPPAPRYNPGSGAAHPRGERPSTPPPRRRDGGPDR